MTKKTKWCGKCGQEVMLSGFVKNRAAPDGLQTECKACRKTHYQESRQRTRDQIRNYLNELRDAATCAYCDETDSCTFDFHHVRGTKRFSLSKAIGYSMKATKEEVAKCIIVCANCHRKIHAGRLDDVQEDS